MLIPLVLGGAALLWLATQKSGSSGSGNFQAVEIDPALGERINQAVLSEDPAFIVSVFDELVKHPKSKEPQMQFGINFLANKLNQKKPVVEVVAGRAGRSYKLQFVSVFPSDGVKMFDVFTPSGSKILRFRQNIDGSKLHIDNPPGVDAQLLSTAREDFGVTFSPGQAVNK